MPHTTRQIVRFLKDNGVQRIRQVDEEFELLLTDGSRHTVKDFFRQLRLQINRRTPRKTKRVGFTEEIRPIPFPRRLGSRRHEVVIRPRFDYESDHDRTEVEKLRQLWRETFEIEKELDKLLNRVRFHKAKIPRSLSIYATGDLKTRRGQEGKRVVNTIIRLQRKQRDKGITEILQMAAEEHDKSYESVQRLWYRYQHNRQ